MFATFSFWDTARKEGPHRKLFSVLFTLCNVVAMILAHRLLEVVGARWGLARGILTGVSYLGLACSLLGVVQFIYQRRKVSAPAPTT